MLVCRLLKHSSTSLLIPLLIILLTFAYSTESSAAPGAAVISGIDSRSVTEDNDLDSDNWLEAGGTLIITDDDTGEAAFIAETISGNYGVLTIGVSGYWSYAANNSWPIIQNLTARDTLTDSLTVSSLDGTTHAVIITIIGVDESAVMLTPSVDVVITPEDVEDQDLQDIVTSYVKIQGS